VTRYRTIVADPPWRYRAPLPAQHGRADARIAKSENRDVTRHSTTPYDTMTVGEIASIPVGEWAENNAHLYLWTTNTHLPYAFEIVEAWGFRYSTLLTWCKAPRGLVGGATYTICTELILYARRGSLRSCTRLDRNWWEWRRTAHSAKPEAFLDIVEQVSPGPYLEMFARRARFGWDYWGNESLGTAEVAA
jgi:N6-adenosine-specific RNA methylase IME4